MQTSNLKANIHIVPFQFVKNSYFEVFCKVVWQRYLGEVGKFRHTVWLIYPRHCVSISIQIKHKKLTSLQHRVRATKSHIQNSTNHFSGIM